MRGFHSKAADIAAASNERRKLGFKVLQDSPMTISMAVSRKLFQEIFGVSLRKRKT